MRGICVLALVNENELKLLLQIGAEIFVRFEFGDDPPDLIIEIECGASAKFLLVNFPEIGEFCHFFEAGVDFFATSGLEIAGGKVFKLFFVKIVRIGFETGFFLGEKIAESVGSEVFAFHF